MSEQGTAITVPERLVRAIYDIRRRHERPAWIILGQEEWLELRRDLPAEYLYALWTDGIPEYHGVRIATVPVAHWLEVVQADDCRHGAT